MGASFRDKAMDLTGEIVAGAALSIVALAGGGLVVGTVGGVAAPGAAVLATMAAALAGGIWVGSADLEDPSTEGGDGDLSDLVRARWLAAGVLCGIGGVFATLWSGGMWSGALPLLLAFPLLLAAPAYGVGRVLPRLGDTDERGPRLDALFAGLTGGALVGGALLLPRFGAPPLLLLAAALLVVPALRAEPRRATREVELHRETTPFGELSVTEVEHPGERQPERRLYLGEEEESGELVRSGAPTLAYIAAAERWLLGGTPRGASYLFLGGGAYTLPRRVAEADPRASVTVVELNPAVTRVASRYFGLRRELGLRVEHAEARAWMERAVDAGETFDRVYLDVYEGREMLPLPLISLEGLALSSRLLTPQGILAMNAIGVAVGEHSVPLRSLVRTVEHVFPTTGVYLHLGPEYPDNQNVLITAARREGAELPQRAGMFELWPPMARPTQPEGVIYRELAAS
jgi:hypothetical protein